MRQGIILLGLISACAGVSSASLAQGPVSASAAARTSPRSTVSALSLVLPEIRLEGRRLSEAVDFLQDATGANFHVNWKALDAQGISRDSTVNLRARHVTVRKGLEMMLSSLAGGEYLAFYNDQGIIEITTKDFADQAFVTRVYDITDLQVLVPTIDPGNANFTTSGTATGRTEDSRSGGIGVSSSRSGGSSVFGGNARSSSSSYSGTSRSGSSAGRAGAGLRGTGTGAGDYRRQMADDLIALIMDTIEPTAWQENGGTGSIRYFPNGKLVITAPRRIHERIGGPIE